MEWIYAAYPSDGDMTIDAIGGKERLNALGRRGVCRRILEGGSTSRGPTRHAQCDQA